MTECERFIKEGKFSPDFFKEEVRDEFLVDENRKKVWAVCIDMLMQLDAVCKKHGLRYFLLFGSLLGAVRHKGFIPWDDDFDVAMLREDWEKLSKLSNEFKHPYFLQNAHTDPGAGSTLMKIRNSNTCQFNKYLSYGGYNSGMALDIFPIDACNPETAEEQFNEMYRIKYKNVLYMKTQSPLCSQEDKDKFAQMGEVDPEQVFDEIQSIASSYKNEKSLLVWVGTAYLYKFNKKVFFREDFSDVELMDFEGYKLPCPKGWRRILTTIYGDYMKYPPVEKRGTWHDSSTFNPDMPYTAYMRSIGVTPNVDKKK